jgi:hypothetical protein
MDIQIPQKSKIIKAIGPKIKKWAIRIFFFVLGVLLSPFILQWFFGFLPGPDVNFLIYGLRQNRGDANICIYYPFQFATDSPIEYVIFKIQISDKINDHTVGLTTNFDLSDPRKLSFAVLQGGKTKDGICEIKGKRLEGQGVVQAHAERNTITVVLSKIPPKTIIGGMIASNSGVSGINPAPPFFVEGTYEYTKFGQTIRKPIPYTYTGVTDAK